MVPFFKGPLFEKIFSDGFLFESYFLRRGKPECFLFERFLFKGGEK